MSFFCFGFRVTGTVGAPKRLLLPQLRQAELGTHFERLLVTTEELCAGPGNPWGGKGGSARSPKKVSVLVKKKQVIGLKTLKKNGLFWKDVPRNCIFCWLAL